MEKGNKMNPAFCLEGMLLNGKYVDLRNVAANYFNMAHNNLYKTLLYILTHSGFNLKLLNALNFTDEKMAEVLQLLYNSSFGSEEEKASIKQGILDKNIKVIKGQDKDTKKSDENILQQANERTSKYFGQIVLTPDVQERIRRQLFKYIPAFGPIMADVASYENYKKRQKSSEIKDKTKEKIQKGINFSHCLDTLILVTETIIFYRNFYTHKHPYNSPEEETAQYEREAKLSKHMENVFKASQRLDKKRELVETKVMDFLTSSGNNYGDPMHRMKKISNGKEEYYDNRTKQNRTRQKYKYVENPDFCFKIFGDHYTTLEGRSANLLSDFGKLFFCCLFLKRPQTQRFAEESHLLDFSPFVLKENEIRKLQKQEDNRVKKENEERQRQGIKRLAKAKTITAKDSMEHEIILDMLGIYHIRKPLAKRIDAKSTPGTLAMDMLNELRRCPSELFQTFDSKDKEIFERKVSLPKDGSPQSSKAEEKVKLIRSTDRFPYLALRYIDETDILGDIRFQVRLGNYRFHFYDKICVDGTQKVRSWQKEINGFGKWHEIEEKRRAEWSKEDLFQKREYVITRQEYGDMELEQPVKDTPQTKPYITDWTTTYNIHANRIGMFWGLADGYYLPSLKSIVNDNDKETGEGHTRHKAPIDMKVPKCSMSVHDLPALLFYQYLWDKEHGAKYKLQKADKIIKETYEGLKEFFTTASKGNDDTGDILTNYHIPRAFIPKRMRNFLDNAFKSKLFNNMNYLKLVESVFGRIDVVDNREIEVPGKLDDVIEEVSYRIKAFNDKIKKIDSGDNKYAKRGYADIRHGVLARYLSKSFVKWQPSKNGGKDKITGMNFSIMNTFLTAYGQQGTFQELKDMLEKAHLLNGQNPHPFLPVVLSDQPATIEELYLSYLTAEKRFADDLNRHSKAIKQFKGDNQAKIDYVLHNEADIDSILAQIPFAHKDRMKWKQTESVNTYYQNYANRYLNYNGQDAIILLPDGLFTPYIISLLKQSHKSDTILMERIKHCETDNKQSLGAAWLIEYYFEHYMKDKHQSFYNPNIFKRAYKPFTTMNNDFVKNQNGGNTTELIPYYNNRQELEEKTKYGRKEVEHFVNNEWKKGKFKKDQEKKDKIDALLGQIKDVRNTERIIRRYRTQDVVLFLSAKELLVKILSKQEGMADAEKQTKKELAEKAQCLKLKDFNYEEGFNFLSEGNTDVDNSMTYEFTYTAKNKKVITITQKGLSLKNYGNIYRILGDDRFKTLMEGLAKINVTKVTFNDITTEFANYDEKRSEIFRTVHQLEDKAYQENHDVLDNMNNPASHIDNNPEKAPKRNNFSSLLKLLKEYDSKDNDVMVNIRNAVGHDYYVLDITQLERTKKKTKTVPNIALLMQITMERKKNKGETQH